MDIRTKTYHCTKSDEGHLKEVDVVEAVKCDYCGSLIEKNSEKYLTIQGNLLVGKGGGILGNSNWEKYGIPSYHFCIKGACLSSYIWKEENDILDRKK